MISWLKRKIKSEQGAMSAFALMSMAFFLIFIVSVLIYFARLDNVQAETLRVLGDKYNDRTEDDMSTTLISNEADVIPIYTLEQLREIGSDKYITIPQNGGKIYKFICQEDLYPEDGSEGRARYKLMQNWTLEELVNVLSDVIYNWSTDPEKGSLFVGLDDNQALGMYIVNFPNVQTGKITIKKELIDSAPKAGQYDAEDSKFLYKITISNAGIIDIQDIQISDVMKRTTTVSGKQNSADVPLTLYKTRDGFELTDEFSGTISLATPIHEDGTVQQIKGVTWDEWYAIYTTTQEDVDNRNTLKNIVTARGTSTGGTITETGAAPDVNFVEQHGYAGKESLVVWYDGADNMAGSANDIGNIMTDFHSVFTNVWYDKDVDEQSNGMITGYKTNTDIYWVDAEAFLFKKSGKVNGVDVVYDRAVKFNGTTELDNIVKDLLNETSHEFCIQFAFMFDFPVKADGTIAKQNVTLYSFGSAENDGKTCRITYDTAEEKLTIEGDKNKKGKTTALIKNGKPYVVTIQGSFTDKVAGMEKKDKYYITYDLRWDELIRDVNSDYTTIDIDEPGDEKRVANFATTNYSTGQDPDTLTRLSFDYNIIGKYWASKKEEAPMRLYCFRLYDRKLTQEEATKNMLTDENRFFN